MAGLLNFANKSTILKNLKCFKKNKLQRKSLSNFIQLSLLCLCINYANLISSQQFPIISTCDENNRCTCEKLDSLEEKEIIQILDTLQGNSAQNPPFFACGYHQLSVNAYYDDDLIQSLEYNKKAEMLRLKFNDGLLWRTLLNTGIYYYDLDEYKLANRYLKKVLLLNEKKESFDSITIFRTLGICNTYLGDFEKGIEFGKSAIEIKDYLDREDINFAKIDLAATLIETNIPEKIELGIHYSKQVIRDSKDKDNKILALINLGRSYRKLKNFDQALGYYNQGLKLCKNDTLNYATILNNIGVLYEHKYIVLKDVSYKNAIDTLNKALKLYKTYYGSDTNYDYSAPYENLGDNFSATMQFDTALRHYQNSLINLTNNFRNKNIFHNPNPKDSTLFIYSNPDIIRVLHLKATAVLKFYQQKTPAYSRQKILYHILKMH